MATVIQVHRFLANLSLGNPTKQQELSNAVEELKQRQQRVRAGSKLYVSKDDLLYRLYIEGLKQKPHQFERSFEGARCVIHTNTPLERADLVLLFLHGLGASPWHFIRVATLLFEANIDGDPRIAFIFPFGTQKMKSGEFGAVEDSLYGSYKWWSIFSGERVAPREAPSPTVEVGLLTGASLTVPSVLREARKSPRIFPPSSAVSSTLNPSLMQYTPVRSVPRGTPLAKDRLMQKTMTYPTIGGRPWTPQSPDMSIDTFPVSLTPKHINLRWYQQCGLCFNRRATTAILQERDPSVREERIQTTKFTVDNPEGRETANKIVMDLLACLEAKYRIPVSRVGICGFSQGAMLALDVFHRLKNSPPSFLAIFSGAPMCVESWRKELQRTAAMKRCPVLQYHGLKDWIFPIFVGRWLHRFLVREGLNVVHYSEFNGDHELTEQSKDHHRYHHHYRHCAVASVVEDFNSWVLKYARDRSAYNFAEGKRRLGSGIANKIDDMFYR